MKPKAMIRTMAIVKTADILKAMDITEELAKRMGFLPRDCLFLRLATEEVCTNAYEYCQKTGSSPQHVLDKQCGFLRKDRQKVLIFPHKRK
ncbi:ATP-binding protein [Geobacillus sp. FJAT-46040]|uniref:ATP-binding protein n=1 Tax=Geobacillus sp. FJAT-46040 TaxID=2011017 RepID=UPI001E3EEA5D|nr:ATP-binding protein [Geobacillus sp. FJAT-46040]